MGTTGLLKILVKALFASYRFVEICRGIMQLCSPMTQQQINKQSIKVTPRKRSGLSLSVATSQLDLIIACKKPKEAYFRMLSNILEQEKLGNKSIP